MRVSSVVSAPGFNAGLVGPLHISVWDAAVTTEHARNAATLLTTLAKSEPRVLVLAVLGPNTPPPDGAVRDIFASEFARLGNRVMAVANVIEGQGFRAAAMRAVVTGLTLVVRANHPQKACATVEEGSLWIAEQSEGAVTASDITRAVLQLRLGSV